ncbi:MAG: serine/threonine protein kinase [Spirochaetota bacterium]
MPKQPDVVGKYEIVEKIAKGGMGVVYKAKHPTLKRFVILKQLTLRAGSGVVNRFRREAALMIDFRDEHIVPVYDHFKHGSSYYIVMEYVDGTSLDRIIEERGKLSTPAAILIFSEICRGLKYAHDKGVVHRDIKPANILISKEGEVKLTDFGIATTKEPDDDGLTHPGMTLGTPAYMSPEQISNPGEVDRRADIYSMGVMLYEMLTGKKPFPSSFTPETVDLINRGAYIKPHKLNPEMPRLFERVIRGLMHRKKHKRYRDLQNVLGILKRFTGKFRDEEEIHAEIRRYISGAEITLPGRFAPGKRARRLFLRLALGFLGTVVIFLTGFFFYSSGYYYEYFRPGKYGRFKVMATVPSNYFKDIEHIYAMAELRSTAPEVTESSKGEKVFRFKLAPSSRKLISRINFISILKRMELQGEESLLTTDSIYLRAGNYNLVLNLENQKLYRSFYLYPRVVQKQNAETQGGMIVKTSLVEPERKPITINHSIRDAETGKSLYGITEILFYKKDTSSWENWKRYTRDPLLKEELNRFLKSGESYSFKYITPLYYPETLSIDVERGMEAVRIEIGLMKKPGFLLVESNQADLEIMIDRISKGFNDKGGKKFISYGRTVRGEKSFEIPAGSYGLRVKKGMFHRAETRFSILPEQTTKLFISYDPEEKLISITR